MRQTDAMLLHRMASRIGIISNILIVEIIHDRFWAIMRERFIERGVMRHDGELWEIRGCGLREEEEEQDEVQWIQYEKLIG